MVGLSSAARMAFSLGPFATTESARVALAGSSAPSHVKLAIGRPASITMTTQQASAETLDIRTPFLTRNVNVMWNGQREVALRRFRTPHLADRILPPAGEC